MQERRATVRREVAEAGRVLLAGNMSVDCRVSDISPSGARLQFDRPVELPGEFRLCLVAVDLTIPAAAAWSDLGQVGVRFTGVGVAGPPASEF